MKTTILADRIKTLGTGQAQRGPVLYWMSRDQRASDNWALLFAAEEARRLQVPLAVVFCLAPSYPRASLRSYTFMLRGLRETADDLAAKAIPFLLLEGAPEVELAAIATRLRAGLVITDFDPLRIKREWRERVAGALIVPLHCVDAHNIVPCWTASDHAEVAARTLRPKLKRCLPRYLTDFPSLPRHPHPWPIPLPPPDWDGAMARLRVPTVGTMPTWIQPGPAAARRVLRDFLQNRLADYPHQARNPTVDGLSNLSPYLHFGQISAQRVAFEVQHSGAPASACEAFLEELIVRRELAENFCYYCERYDTPDAWPAWARASLRRHQSDPRPYRYTLKQFENAETHDALWNAAQTEMIKRGKMHGYMRMYWAKKILEWSPSAEEALAIAIDLNDRYELDGRDPNGYASIAWAIGGLHDRPWPERPVFGKIRSMTAAGCRAKFDVEAYIRRVAAF